MTCSRIVHRIHNTIFEGRPREERKRNGIARLTLRAAVGGTMVAHGIRHGRSPDGTARWFGSIGFCEPRVQAIASAVVEIGAVQR